MTVLSLGTHTFGGLPLQFPDDVRNETELTSYYLRWRPAYVPATYRSYGNPTEYGRRFRRAGRETDLSAAPELSAAIRDTHAGDFRAGSMTQDLIWEQYALPAALADPLEDNAYEIIMQPNPVVELNPAEPPRADVWIDKTGSTAGFGAYIAFVPQRRAGAVILANKNFPIPDRVRLARELLGRAAESGTGQTTARHE